MTNKLQCGKPSFNIDLGKWQIQSISRWAVGRRSSMYNSRATGSISGWYMYTYSYRVGDARLREQDSWNWPGPILASATSGFSSYVKLAY